MVLSRDPDTSLDLPRENINATDHWHRVQDLGVIDFVVVLNLAPEIVAYTPIGARSRTTVLGAAVVIGLC